MSTRPSHSPQKAEDGAAPDALAFSHLDADGQAHMVNIAEKPITKRTATAVAICVMQPATSAAIQSNTLAKGDVLSVARIAAIQAAKRTDELIPLCHSLPIEGVQVDFSWLSATQLKITVSAAVTGRTGVEMEAMVGASIAALTVYDMCKAVDRSMRVESVALQSKSGGTSGDFQREQQSEES